MLFWKSQWGNDAYFSHASTRSAGVCTLKNKFIQSILHIDTDENGHYICQIVNIQNINFIIINIYGYNSTTESNDLLYDVESRILYWLSKFPNAHILFGGDFNIALDNMIDRWPPVSQSNTSAVLKMLMQRFDLIDIWRENFPTDTIFTWSNKSKSRQSQIDFWLISSNPPCVLIN